LRVTSIDVIPPSTSGPNPSNPSTGTPIPPPAPGDDSKKDDDKDDDDNKTDGIAINTLNEFQSFDARRISARTSVTKIDFAALESQGVTQSAIDSRVQLADGLEASSGFGILNASRRLANSTLDFEISTSTFEVTSIALPLDAFQEQMLSEQESREYVSGSATAVFVGAATMTAILLASSSSMVALFASSLPTWVNFDPIYLMSSAVSQSDDKSLTDLVKEMRPN
ncbi:MAG: hypothetical protein AAF497_01015, partial [Planctomycetota bacterium]